MPFPTFHLYLVTGRTQTFGRDLLWISEQALDAGVKAIQLREKDLSGKDLFHLAEKMSRLCQAYGSSLFINDRIDIALAVDAAGVQLGTASVDIQTTRRLLGSHKMIGVSTHSSREALLAEKGGADFVLFGPVYFTVSKAPYGSPQGIEALEEVVAKIRLPVYAIGGITSQNVGAAKRAGAFGVALISAIMSATAPKSATIKLLSAWYERNSPASF